MSAEYLIDYSSGTKNVCICTIVSILLILIFIVSPVSNFIIASLFGKFLILAILTFVLYKNISITFAFSKNVGGIFNGEWSALKTNILCSYTFSIFIGILIFSVLNRLFR
jgi:hypothetical protein